MSKYKIVYGKEHEKFLNEIGIDNLDDARKVYAAYDGDFVVDMLLPYVLGDKGAGWENTAEDLVTMLTAWKPEQTEAEYVLEDD